MSFIWKVGSNSNFSNVDYVRADSMDEAKKAYDSKHCVKSVSFQKVDHQVQKVIFNDCSQLFCKGTKTDARKSATLYIKQWQLDCKIESIITV